VNLDIDWLTALALFLDSEKYLALVMAGFAVLTYALTKDRKGIFLLAANMVVSVVLLSVAKGFFYTPRQCVSGPAKIACTPDSSYPSGHAFVTASGALAMAGNVLFPLYLAFSAITALTRLYPALHTIYDIAGGIAFAFISYAITKRLMKVIGHDK